MHWCSRKNKKDLKLFMISPVYIVETQIRGCVSKNKMMKGIKSMKNEKRKKMKQWQGKIVAFLLLVLFVERSVNVEAMELIDKINVTGASELNKQTVSMNDSWENEISENELPVKEEKCGEDIESDTEQSADLIASGNGWTLDKNGHLEVHYKNSRPEYRKPWGFGYDEQIKTASLYLEDYTSLADLLYECPNLESVDFQNSDFSHVETAKNLFGECTSLKEIKGLKLPHVKAINYMFCDCSALKVIDADMFASDCLENVSYLFQNCSSLTEIKNLDKIDLSRVEATSEMFENNIAMESLDIQKLNVAHVKNMAGMFLGCKNLKNLDFSGWDTSSVKNMEAMFAGCEYVTTFNWDQFDTSNVTNMEAMFALCGEGRLDLSQFQTSQVQNMNQMFFLSRFQEINLENFNTENVTNMTFLFFGCVNLEKVNIQSFRTPKLKNCYEMFSSCESLKEIDLSNFDFSSLDTEIRYSGCVTELETLLYGANSLRKLILPANVPQEIRLSGVNGYWYDENDVNIGYTYVNLNVPATYHGISMSEYYAAMEEAEKKEEQKKTDKQNQVSADKESYKGKQPQYSSNRKTNSKKKQKITYRGNRKKIITIRKVNIRKNKRTYKIPVTFNNGGIHTVPVYKLISYPRNGKKYIKVSQRGVLTFSKKAKKGKYRIKIELPESASFQSTSIYITVRIK